MAKTFDEALRAAFDAGVEYQAGRPRSLDPARAFERFRARLGDGLPVAAYQPCGTVSPIDGVPCIDDPACEVVRPYVKQHSTRCVSTRSQRTANEDRVQSLPPPRATSMPKPGTVWG